MVARSLISALLAAALFASGAWAADYRPGDFLNLDLSQAVFSKTPLGPPAEFAPVAVEAKGDRGSEPAWARNELKVEPRKVRTVSAAQQNRPAHVASVKRPGATRMRVARHPYGDPMNAKAMDTRIQRPIQTWPCRSRGGICDWER